MARHQVGIAPRLVALGASAGGVEALAKVVAGLAPDFPAAVLVVLHVSPWGTSVLPDILSRRGPLPARHAVDGEPVLASRIYVAPPDRHLTVVDGMVSLTRGPRENGVRPAVDTLFRSAATAYGRDVVAIVLSGTLQDGTAGLRVVRDHGGVTIAQDPDDALFPSMPASAVRSVNPDHVLPADAIPAVLAACMQTRAPR